MAVATQTHELSGVARALGRITPVAGQLRFLDEVGGSRLITAVGSDGDTDLTRRWLTAAAIPDADQAARLRHAFTAAWLLSHHMPVESVAQWFRTRHAGLGSSPILALRHGRGGELLTSAGLTAAAHSGPSHQPPYTTCGEHG